MLVHVVQLRCAGRKLPGDAVLRSTPTRGELVLRMFSKGFRGEDVEPHQVASLIDNGGGFRRMLLPDLRNARVKIEEGKPDFVILGEEYRRVQEGEPVMAYPQAWWCRIVTKP